MSLKWAAVLLLGLLLLEQAAAKNITLEQLALMQKGIEAGRKFTEVLDKGPFQQFVAEAETFGPPFMIAISILMKIIEEIKKQLILEAVIKGFREVNNNLERVIEKLAEVKKLIEWRDMQVRFGEIEYKIRLLDETLKQVLRAPDRNASIENFKKVYRREYSSAGFALYDAVANNDQIFSRNLLTAAIKFSDVHRNKTQAFSRGLFGLLMKAACIEIAHEKFSKSDIGKKDTWTERLQKSAKAIQAADVKVLTEAWKPQIRIDSDATAKQLQSVNSNQHFADTLYAFLTKKYPWRYFLVTAFASTDSTKTQCQASVLPDHGYSGLEKFGRSYFVVSTDPKNKFNPEEAFFYISNHACPASASACGQYCAYWMMALSPDYGIARMVVAKHFSENWGFAAKEDRYTMGEAALTTRSGRITWHSYIFIYFG